MKDYNFLIKISCLIAVLICYGCSKEFLDEKPSTAIVQPKSLEEFQSLLDNYTANNVTVGLGILSTDEYEYMSDALWLSARTATERNAYIWAKDLYEGEQADDWNKPYTTIFYANNVLAGLENMGGARSNEWKNLKGWALFLRAFANYELVNNFAPIYDQATAANDLGVPLRLKPSIDQLAPRPTVAANYGQILTDLTAATALLPIAIPAANRNRPSKVAAHALFARIYLTRRDYDKAEHHADTCLQLYDKLIDYNALNKTTAIPFSIINDELIYSKYAATRASYGVSNPFVKVAPSLISLYALNDLRLTIFYSRLADGSYITKRGYQGNVYPFVGLATDEVYLIKAECLARRNEAVAAMAVLDRLLAKRWDPNASSPSIPYQNLSASSAQDALKKVLLERRKELVWRGLRWDDLKRLNKEGADIELSRMVNGQRYTLLPNSPKYVFPIPDDEINLSGLTQNQR